MNNSNNGSSVALTIPDPRLAPIPQGWATDTFAVMADVLEWEDLKDAEAHLLGLASYIESLGGDRTELEKAIRIVEYRKVVCLGDPRPGHRSDREPLTCTLEVDASAMTVSRWRKIASEWDRVVWPHLLAAKEAREVSQNALLRLVDEHRKREVGPESGAAKPEPEPSTNGSHPPGGNADSLSGETDAYDPAGDEVDPIAEWERTAREKEAVEVERDELKAALESSDVGAELVKLQERYARLEGRLNAEINKANAAVKQAKYQGDILGKLRRLLKVDSNSELVGAVQDMVS